MAALIVISQIYEERIAQYAINELNKHIRTPISVTKTTLTLIRKFPDATIRLRDVYVKSVQDFDRDDFQEINTDTLLYAKDVFLQMNLIKLLRNQYIVKEVHINNGSLNIFNDKNGLGNYRFWESGKTDETSTFTVELQNVKMSGIYFRSLNLAKATNLQARINKSIVHGDLSAQDYQLNFLLDGNIINYISDNFNYLYDKKVITRSAIHVVNNSFQIISSNLEIEGLKFSIEGTAERDKNILMDMVIAGKDLNIETLMKNFPLKKHATILSKYKATGVLDFKATISGIYSNKLMPGLIADFTVKNGSFYSNDPEKFFNKIGISGHFTNGTKHNARTSLLRVEKVTVEWGKSRAGGSFMMKNLTRPEIDYQIKAELNIPDILPYFNTDKFEYCNGKLMMNVNIKGHQDSLFNITKENLLHWQYDGFLVPENICFKLAGYPLIFEQINGTVILGNYLYLNDIGITISSNDLNISGRVDNFLEYIFTEKGNLWMDIDIYSPDLIMDSLIYKNPESDKDADIFPDRIYLNSRFWFDHFHYYNFDAENLRGDIIFRPGWLVFNSFDLSSMDGTLRGNGFIEQEEQTGYMIRMKSIVKNLDITKLFQSFNNFGQVYIQDKHLKGKISGEVDFYAGFDDHFRIQKESILTESDVEIVDGELIHFEPMLGLSKFIEVEELQQIKFSTLKNRIFIRQSEVIIPQMDIYSSALNISGSGTHHFNNYFSYKVSLDLSDLLLKKPRKNELKFEEHVIQDDGVGRTRIFLTIEGTPDDYEINYDRKGAIMSLKEKLDDEKEELRTILKEEFGLFRNDTLQEKQPDMTQPGFIFKWEDTDSTEVDSVRQDTIKQQQFIIEWDDEQLNGADQQQNTKKNRK